MSNGARSGREKARESVRSSITVGASALPRNTKITTFLFRNSPFQIDDDDVPRKARE